MNRAVARRCAALVAATAVLAGGAALVAPSAQAAALVSVVSQSHFLDSVGTDNIVGEVRNSGSTNIEQVVLNIQFMSASNVVLGSDTTNAMVSRLAPGEKSPFLLNFLAPAGFDHAAVVATASDAAGDPNHNFTTSLPTVTTEPSGLRHLSGTVRNDNSTGAEFVNVVLTFYSGPDQTGQVVNAASEFVTDDVIAPGASSTVEELVETPPAYASYSILAQSLTDAAPAASPTASPEPTSTVAPSPSPSPSAVAEVTPTVMLGSDIISAGQRVTVTYHGTPSTTLQILSKTQPATAYSVISSVVLDAKGVGSTSHAPQKNTRMMARTAGGLSSLNPLIQVRSVASINAARVSTRTYSFSGRVYPALNGRLVSIYRNGRLFAQGRTDASGIYRITRTSAAGTFSFQARTANDTYNLGTSSPARTYTIR